MFQRSPYIASIVIVFWIFISIAYMIFIFLPKDINIIVGIVCCFVAAAAIALLPARQMMLKTYLVGFSVATWLSAFQVSTSQRPFEADFLVFFTLHALLLGAAIGAASLVAPRRHMPAEDRWRVANLAVYAFVALAAYISITTGFRLTDFLSGEKYSGDIYKIPGLSGIQGILSIFILCCFSKLKNINRIIFIISIILIAMIDVKRGDVIRIITFLIFFGAIVNKKYNKIIIITALIGVFIFIIFGEVRQQLYSDGFSISRMMDSRIAVSAVDWVYGYIGINVSVLQEYFYSITAPTGYFPTLSILVFNTEIPEIDQISILGFNAGTVFSMFAGQESVSPNFDFMMFCVLVAVMVAFASWLGTPSLRAFMLVQVFGFVFGNQLILPYYLIGFFGAVAYQSLPRIVLGGRSVLKRGSRSVERHASSGPT